MVNKQPLKWNSEKLASRLGKGIESLFVHITEVVG